MNYSSVCERQEFVDCRETNEPVHEILHVVRFYEVGHHCETLPRASVQVTSGTNIDDFSG